MKQKQRYMRMKWVNVGILQCIRFKTAPYLFIYVSEWTYVGDSGSLKTTHTEWALLQFTRTVIYSIYYKVFFGFCAFSSLNDCECVCALARTLTKNKESWSAWETNNDVWKNGEIYIYLYILILHPLQYCLYTVSKWWTNELSAAATYTLFPYFNWMSHIWIYETAFFDNDYKFVCIFFCWIPKMQSRLCASTYKNIGNHLHYNSHETINSFLRL